MKREYSQGETKMPQIFYSARIKGEKTVFAPHKSKTIEIGGFEDFVFFAYKTECGGWWVCEATSGLAVNRWMCVTRKEAIANAAEVLAKRGEIAFRHVIAEAIRRYGKAPTPTDS